VDAPTATWKVILLGIIAALLIALGAGASVLPDQSNSVAAYQQATRCTAASTSSDNCYAVVPVTVVRASANHLRKGGPEEHVIVQAPSGPSEIVLPWESQQDQVLLAGATGTVDVYRGVPVLLAVGGYQFATIQSPVVQKAQTRWIGWIFLSLGLAFGGVVVLQILTRRRRASVPVPSSDAFRQAIVQLPPETHRLSRRDKEAREVFGVFRQQFVHLKHLVGRDWWHQASSSAMQFQLKLKHRTEILSVHGLVSIEPRG
jgi:hypothetical protein